MRHVRRIMAGDDVLNRSRDCERDQAGAAAERGHAAERDRAAHAARAADQERPAEVAFVAIGASRRKAGQGSGCYVFDGHDLAVRCCGMSAGRDQAGHVGGFESCVDIDDGDVARAAVEHRKERGDAAKIRAVADARWDADHGAGDVAADDAGEGAFHAGDDDDGVGILELGEPGRESMGPGDADVLDERGADAHPIERFADFFDDRLIAGAGRDHGDPGYARRSSGGRVGRLVS